LKCGVAGEEWRKLVEPIVLKVKKFYVESNTKGISYKKNIKGNWIRHIFPRDCPVKHVIDRKIEVTIEVLGKRGRRCKQLLDGLKQTRNYWKLKAEAADRTAWRTRFGKDKGLFLRQTA